MEKVRRTDSFFIYSKTSLNPTDHQVLSLLYLPLIGTQAYSLYGLFSHLLNRQTLKSDVYLHSDLESLLSHKLSTIEIARHHLEAIGLLNVYFYNDCFAYELLSPLTPYAFINDGILGQYLQAAVTENRFKKICQLFKIESWDKASYIPITKSFNDVYPHMGQSDFVPIEGLMNGSKRSNIQIKKTDFDFRLFTESIPTPFLDANQLTPEAKTKLVNLAFVYGLDELAMKDVYLKSTNEFHQLDLVKLTKYAREAFKIQKASVASTNESSAQTESSTSMKADPLTYLKTATPKQLLSDLSGGMVSSADLRIMERLIDVIGIDRGVANVLVFHVVTTKDGRMPSYEYFEKVAMDWKRNQINTVEDALDYIKHLSSERKESSTSTKKPYRKNQSSKPDVKIDWLDDYLKSIE